MNIICFVLAGLVFISGLFIHAESAIQQTVQYLIFVIASVFLCTGFIITSIYQLMDNFNKNNTHAQSSHYNKESDVLDNLHKAVVEKSNASDTWTCKKCGCVNPDTASQCKDCGEYK